MRKLWIIVSIEYYNSPLFCRVDFGRVVVARVHFVVMEDMVKKWGM